MDNESATQTVPHTPPPPTAPLQNDQTPQQQPVTTVAHSDNNQIITILLLIFLYPVGIAVMWVRMKHWPTWLKTLITAPLVISVVGAIAAMLFVMFVPVQFV